MTETGHSSDAEGSDEHVVADGTGVETGGQPTAVATDSRTNERLVKAVGTYLVTGVGFVFTLFLVAQFAGGDVIGSGNPFGDIGAGAGYALALVLSPLVAVFVGADIGKEGGGDAVVDAGIATAVGFVVMFFVTLVLAASLGGGSVSGAQAGPMMGLAIGVAITGAASAAAARWEQGFLDGVANPPLVKSIVFGSLAFLVFTIGFVIAIVLADALSSGAGGAFGLSGGEQLIGLGILFAPLLAVLVGFFAGRDGLETAPQGAISGAIGSAVGALLMIVGLLVTVAILQQGGGSIPIPVGPIVGIVVGAGLTGAGAGYVGAR